MCNKKNNLSLLSSIVITTLGIVSISAFFIIKNKRQLKENFSAKGNLHEKLDLYFKQLTKHFEYDILSDYKGYFFSISPENINILQNNYPEIKADTIKFPFYSDSLIENMADIKMYLKDEIKKFKITIEVNNENDYDYLIKNLKKVLLKEAQIKILTNIKPLIKDSKEIEKWQELYSSEPSSMLI